MAVIAAAPPGDEPQAAVAAGIELNRASSQPATPAAAIVVPTTTSITTHERAIDATTGGVNVWAIRVPIDGLCPVERDARDVHLRETAHGGGDAGQERTDQPRRGDARALQGLGREHARRDQRDPNDGLASVHFR